MDPGVNSPEYRAPDASDEDPLAGTRALPFTPMTLPDSRSFRPERSPLHAERAPDRTSVEGVLTATAKAVAGEPVASVMRAAGEPAAPHISSGLWTGAKASAPHAVSTGATTPGTSAPIHLGDDPDVLTIGSGSQRSVRTTASARVRFEAELAAERRRSAAYLAEIDEMRRAEVRRVCASRPSVSNSGGADDARNSTPEPALGEAHTCVAPTGGERSPGPSGIRTEFASACEGS